MAFFAVSTLDHTNNDCLVVTVMTHGDGQNLASFDLDYKLKLITKYFTDLRCPSLKNKPRLFFIQACRAKPEYAKWDLGYVLPENQPYLERSRQYRQRLRDEVQETDAAGDDVADESSDEESESEEDMAHNAPIEKDFLIVRSTMPGYESYRDTNTGSWFIQELCNELEKHAVGSDLLSLLTRVNLRVAGRESLVDSGKGKKQILCISSRLTRIMVINDKSEQQNSSEQIEGDVEADGEESEAEKLTKSVKPE